MDLHTCIIAHKSVKRAVSFVKRQGTSSFFVSIARLGPVYRLDEASILIPPFTPLQAEPLLRLVPGAGALLDACWSPARPGVFALSSAQGSVLIYDLMVRQA